MCSWMTTQVTLLWIPLFICPLAETFKPLFSGVSGSLTHRDITQRAIYRKTAQVCQTMAANQGQGFNLSIDDSLTAYSLQRACSSGSPSLLSTLAFQTAVAKTYLSNAAVDVALALSAPHHFDDESFEAGRDLVVQGAAAVKAAVKQGSFISARISLGSALHPLQDFYSHSNWVEMGNTAPFSNLIRGDTQLDNLAGPTTATCRNCTGGNCTDNILPEVLQQKQLTSGYFSLFSASKPTGKCSHGGSFDKTSQHDPTGGINKDDASESHGYLHLQAAEVAVNATMEILEDIRLAIGDKNFLRLMGMSQSAVLCFVIDTTGSMADDIAEAKRVSFSIIDLKRGSQEEPSEYILVPFNDPGVGPLIRTTDADVFKQEINKLTASGGGDIPEMCLSGLLLALTAAPPSSDIFVFTDAPAKDAVLKSILTALIEATKSKVTFMLTDVTRSGRRRRQLSGAAPRAMSAADAQVYWDLAQSSGGQAIEVTKASLPDATIVIEDSSTSALVTLLQAMRTSAGSQSFSFFLDESVFNVTVYITGTSPVFSLYSPTGDSQSNEMSDGPLGTVTKVGNLQRIQVNTSNRTGLWSITINTTETFVVKVTGQSSINFLFHLVEAHEGAHGDFSLKQSRPSVGKSFTMLMSVTGGDSPSITEVQLEPASSGAAAVNGTVEAIGGGDFLVTFSEPPEGEFSVRVKGESAAAAAAASGNRASPRSATSQFQRQASTQLKASRVTVKAAANGTIEPGATVTVPFTVETNTTAGTYTIQARNDREFTMTSPSSLTLKTGEKAEGTVTLTAPPSTASGTDVTLTIEAQAPGDTDSNYVVLSFAVAARVTDLTRPECQVSVTANCSLDCTQDTWELSANMTDGNGTGISSVTLQQGNGTLNTTTTGGGGSGVGITFATYSASCCSQEVELLMVDEVGNTAVCSASIRDTSSGAGLHLPAASCWLWPVVVLILCRLWT